MSLLNFIADLWSNSFVRWGTAWAVVVVIILLFFRGATQGDGDDE